MLTASIAFARVSDRQTDGQWRRGTD